VGRVVEDVGFAGGQVGQLGDGEARQWDAPAGVGPGLPPEPGHHAVGLGGAGRVVPERGRPQHPVVPVEAHEAVLLAGHCDRGHACAVRSALADRLHQRAPPVVGVLFGVGRVGRRVRGPTGGDQFAGVGVAELDLRRLGRRVDAGDERSAHRTPRRSSTTSWSRRS